MTATSDAVTSGYAGRVIWGAFIGGTFTETGNEETFAVTEPATGGRSRGSSAAAPASSTGR